MKDGIELISALPWLKPVMPAAGFQLGRELSPEQRAEVEFGLRIAREVSRLEIGQSVVVKEGTVLAVEGFEGTDKCLMRGGDLAGKSGGAVAVKVAKENHDMRFDIPCVGPRTIETCLEHGLEVLAFDGGRTLLLDQPEVEALLKKHRRFSLVAMA
jgi:UDP-2,3-diacylglucosamine hydrolase